MDNKTVFLAYNQGIDHSYIFGIGTDMEAAKKIIQTQARKDQMTLTELASGDEFKITSLHGNPYNSGEDYDFWIKEQKVNKPF